MSAIASSTGGAAGPATVRVGHRICAIGAAIARGWRARRDLAVLMAQSDRMLHDIGVSRGEIQQAVLGYVR